MNTTSSETRFWLSQDGGWKEVSEEDYVKTLTNFGFKASYNKDGTLASAGFGVNKVSGRTTGKELPEGVYANDEKFVEAFKNSSGVFPS